MVLSLTLQDVSLYPQTALAPLAKPSGRLDRNHSVLIGQPAEIKQQRKEDFYMNRYNSKTARWQQQEKKEQWMNKTEFIRVRCTLEEKQRIKSKAESAGRKFSDYCREILLNGEVTAVPKMTDNEKEAIEVLRRTAYFFTHVSNLIKVKDDAWVLITQSLSYLAREAFKRFFNPKYRIEERAIKLLNLMENDRKM